jgi:alkyl hydroperoxide reductase subunit AhpF
MPLMTVWSNSLSNELTSPKKLGGQIEYTASIENYLGLPSVSGTEMAEAVRNHLENYPIAEALVQTWCKSRKWTTVS